MNHKLTNPEIVGRILVSGLLTTRSPLSISQGEGVDTDSDIVLDGSGAPFIPATSWVGALRAHLENAVDSDLMEIVFGGDGEYQSAFIAQDLVLKSKSKLEIRPGQAVDPISQTTRESSLHNYEALSPGNVFDFGFEVVIRNEYKDRYDQITRLVKTIIYEFGREAIHLGGLTNSGFGRIKLESVKYRELQFPSDVDWWFSSNRIPDELVEISETDIFIMKSNDAILQGRFVLDGSILVRQKYSGDDKNIDTEQMNSNGKNIIPGTSLKGAIRHRATKILKTFIPDQCGRIIEDLFGYIKESGRDSKAQKGRISFGECYIEGGIVEKQTRIKTDHFTAGVMTHALFSELPLWSDEHTTIDVTIKISSASPFEVALTLQVLKDLWQGRLTLGGEASIGRGRFMGEELSISFRDKELRFSAQENEVKIDDKDGLLDLLETNWKEIIDSREVA